MNRDNIYAPMLNHGEGDANEYLNNNLISTTSLTIDEIKKEKGKRKRPYNKY